MVDGKLVPIGSPEEQNEPPALICFQTQPSEQIEDNRVTRRTWKALCAGERRWKRSGKGVVNREPRSIDVGTRPCYPVPVSYWFVRLYVRSNGCWQFIPFCWRANANGLAVFNCPPASYMTRNFGRRLFCLPPAFTLVSCSAYSSTQKMEVTCSSETLVGFQRTARRYIPEDRTLHNHNCENLKSYSEGVP
jgi:hypothetical protein